MNQAEALTWLANLLEEPPENVGPDTHRDEIAGWDSLGVLTLMAELDEKFEIRLDAEEMKAMTRVKDVLALLERHGALTA